MKKFVWGEIITCFNYDFDGEVMEVVKYHPWERKGHGVTSGVPDVGKVLYHCGFLHESYETLFTLVISFIVNKQLGLNQSALVMGIARSLECCE